MIAESELISNIKSGDVAAFSQLIKLHQKMVFAVIYRMVDSLEDTEELAQDVFVKAFKSIKLFEGKSKFSTWIYKIAYFTAINHLRKKKMLQVPIHEAWIADVDESTLHTLNADDQKYYIKSAMKYLKPIERELITLYYLEELSNKEVAEITGMSLSNIKVSILRIRKKMLGILNALLKDEAINLIKN
ncbi:RNA polymerase sigma factor [Putridiphycobacter roseus]|uniref:RNA polymerase sigma factor n=1 Tax=Putridiphycobacter roseus TaxID=2219161 RepID=UPI001F2676E0|nr:RNA polymerase sigma factor [Putridiphycobacter roseus]